MGGRRLILSLATVASPEELLMSRQKQVHLREPILGGGQSPLSHEGFLSQWITSLCSGQLQNFRVRHKMKQGPLRAY